MSLFAEYVQPLTAWLHENPQWALFITFIISFTESLAIVGSIIPGSFTMTAMGILAGSGVMRIDLTLLAAILGAIAGDSGSYFLGYYFSDRLMNIWPFSRYPNWLKIGQDYFDHHGGKSVLIGRFIGPLRSIIPVIAGMMHMKQWRFLLANSLSAIGWSILYLGPGILIGAASTELSAENATRFFLTILFLIAIFWLLGIFLKWIFLRVNHILAKNLHHLWAWSKKHPYLSKYFLYFTPKHEKDHYATALLVSLLLFFLLISSVLILLAYSTQFLTHSNQALYLLFQSLRMPELDYLMIFFSQFSSTITFATVLTASLVVFIIKKNYRMAAFSLSAFFTAWLIAYALSFLIESQGPQGNLVNTPGSSFPDIPLCIATAFYGFLCFYLNTFKHNPYSRILKITFIAIIFLTGFAALYFGNYWFGDVLASLILGFILADLHWLFYRRAEKIKARTHFPSFLMLALLIISGSLSTQLNAVRLMHNHSPYHKQFILSTKTWWAQKKPILPIYRTNRIGHNVSLLNIQYDGSLKELTTHLEKLGWKSYNQSLLNRMVNTMSAEGRKNNLPLLRQLYNNQKPAFLMAYHDEKCHCLIVFRLWASNYYLEKMNHHVWIGSINVNKENKLLKHGNSSKSGIFIKPEEYLPLPTETFKIRSLKLPEEVKKSFRNGVDTSVLLIKMHVD